MRHWIRTALAGVALGVSGQAWGQAAPKVTLTTQVSQPTVNVGDVFTITVSGSVSGGTASDGIVAYDLDLIPTDKTLVQLIGPVTQTGETSLSAGTPQAGTGGLLGISGAFDGNGAGIGTTATLFTVQAKALAAGSTSVFAGLSTFLPEPPNTGGIPFTLNVSGDVASQNVDSSGAIAAVTIAAPEPASVGILGLAIFAILVSRKTPAGGRVRVPVRIGI